MKYVKPMATKVGNVSELVKGSSGNTCEMSLRCYGTPGTLGYYCEPWCSGKYN